MSKCVDRGGAGEDYGPPLNFWEKLCVFHYNRKIKIISIKEDYRNGKKRRKREDFNYISKAILKLIISNTDFWTGYVLGMDSYVILPL